MKSRLSTYAATAAGLNGLNNKPYSSVDGYGEVYHKRQELPILLA